MARIANSEFWDFFERRKCAVTRMSAEVSERMCMNNRSEQRVAPLTVYIAAEATGMTNGGVVEKANDR